MRLTDQLRRQLLVRLYQRAGGDAQHFADELVREYGNDLDKVLKNEADRRANELDSAKVHHADQVSVIDAELGALRT